LDYRTRWQQKRRLRANRQRVAAMVGVGAVALVLLILLAGQRPRAAASYRLPGPDVCWLAAGDQALFICQRQGRLTKLTSAMSEAGSGWARPFTHPAGFYGRVALGGGLAVLGCADGRLRALDVRTGEQIWEKVAWQRATEASTGAPTAPRAAAGAVGGVTLSGGAAFFGADDGLLHAVELSKGGALWHADLGAGIASAPLVTEEEVVVGTVAGVVHCVDRGRGHKLWRFPETERMGPIYASARSGPEGILVGSDDGKLYSLSREGQLQGTYELGGLVRAPVAVCGRAVVAGDSEGSLCRLNVAGLSETWRRSLSSLGGIAVEPIVDGDRIWCAAGKYLVCLRLESGRVLWRRKGNAETTDCVRAGERLYWATADGVVRAVRVEP
jgi:outer membrane protein assembly factor BamB